MEIENGWNINGTSAKDQAIGRTQPIVWNWGCFSWWQKYEELMKRTNEWEIGGVSTSNGEFGGVSADNIEIGWLSADSREISGVSAGSR